MKPQFILRYGATFQGYENLIYTLTAVDSFNRNLVKGVIGHITEFESGKNAIVKFIDSDGTEASFELRDRGLLYYQLGQFSQAMEDLQIYLIKVPDAKDADVIRQLLAKLN